MEDKGSNEIGVVDPVLTSSEQKIWDYLKEHKTPVNAATLAKRFIISKSRASNILAMLDRAGMVDTIKMGSVKFYKRREL